MAEPKKKNELKEKMTKQSEEGKKQIENETAQEKEKEKQNIEEEYKKWEETKEERIKRFLQTREDKTSALTPEGEQRKRRARTLASGAPASQFLELEKAREAVKKQREEEEAAKSGRGGRGAPPKPQKPQRPIFNQRMVPSVPMPPSEKLTKEQIFDKDGKPNPKLLRDHFLKEGKITHDAAMAILEKVGPIYRKEPNLLELEATINVVGDIHGQYFDFVTLLDSAGEPGTIQYLFLGDYVDRGCFGVEVCFLLFAYKICHPYTFFMLRGNHESRLLTTHFNFKHECYYKYDAEIYDAIMNVFDCFPIAALVTNAQGTFFCTHGGLSPDIMQLDDIEDVDRFMEPPERGPLCDLLWSDPIEESTAVGLSEEDMEEWYDVDYVPNPTRGCGYVFGFAAVAPFLENNNLLCVIRAHEVQKDGYHCHYYWKNDIDFPLTITVFSAPNYCDIYGNQGGFIKFNDNDFEFHQIPWVDHPYYLPNYMNAITYSLPYALEAFTKLCAYILEGCMNSGADDDLHEEKTDLSIRTKLDQFSKMSVLAQRIREKRQEILEGTVNLGEEVAKFEQALQLDGKNEKARPQPVFVQRRRTRTL